jgi:hypothetical protein
MRLTVPPRIGGKHHPRPHPPWWQAPTSAPRHLGPLRPLVDQRPGCTMLATTQGSFTAPQWRGTDTTWASLLQATIYRCTHRGSHDPLELLLHDQRNWVPLSFRESILASLQANETCATLATSMKTDLQHLKSCKSTMVVDLQMISPEQDMLPSMPLSYACCTCLTSMGNLTWLITFIILT